MKLKAMLCMLLGLLIGCQTAGPKDSKEPSLSEIYVRKGIQYMENGALDIALEDLKHAIDLDSRNSEAHDAIAVLYERLNKPTDAEEHYQRALSLNENNADALNNYGRFLCGLGKSDKAMGYFSQLIASRTYAKPWLSLTNAGLCAESVGKNIEAEAYLRKALEENQSFPPALLEMAKLSLKNQQYLSARAFLQRLEATGGMNQEALEIAIQTEKALGNFQAADAYVKTLRSRFPNKHINP